MKSLRIVSSNVEELTLEMNAVCENVGPTSPHEVLRIRSRSVDLSYVADLVQAAEVLETVDGSFFVPPDPLEQFAVTIWHTEKGREYSGIFTVTKAEFFEKTVEIRIDGKNVECKVERCRIHLRSETSFNLLTCKQVGVNVVTFV